MSGGLPQGPARTLGSFVAGRDNNFNLIRFLAASAVLVSHSFALSTGTSASEPWGRLLGITPGSTAVEIFFLTSGFLVTASLVRRKDVRSFALARMLRIYPGLFVAVSLTVLAVGSSFTSLSPSSFFTNAQTWIYWARTTTLVTNVAHLLPGAFEGNPWRFAVNSSLWTLPYELTMYAVLALTWIAVACLHKSASGLFERVIVALAAVLMLTYLLLIGIVTSSALRLSAMFFVGSALYVLKDRVPMSGRIFAVVLAVLIASMFEKKVFAYCYPLALPYLVFYLAYVPGGIVRSFNRIGDYSYGIYIYAWPVQQMTAALVPGVKPLEMFVLSYLGTCTLAVASWHLIEKPSLAMKSEASPASFNGEVASPSPDALPAPQD